MAKPLKTLDLRWQNGLAAKLLCVFCVLVTFATSGCLLPQDDQVLPRLPDALNLPPHILDTGRKPLDPETTVKVGVSASTSCIPEFVILVDDDSPTVRDRWFIDPNASYQPTPQNQGHEGSGATGTAGKARELKAPRDLVIALANFIDGERHRVEVVITDGTFVDNPVTGGLDFKSNQTGVDENGTVQTQPVYHTNYTWFVEVQPCQ